MTSSGDSRPPKKHRSKKSRALSTARPLLFVFGAIISAVCLYLAFRKVPLESFVHDFQRMKWEALVGALILVNLHNFLLAKRWHLLIQHLGRCGYWVAFWSLRLSFFFNASLPARLGEPFRVWFIHRMTKIPMARTVGAMGADRLQDFISLCVLVYLSALVLGLRGALPPTKSIIGVSVAAVLVFVLMARLPKASRWPWLHWLLVQRQRIFEGIYSLKSFKVIRLTLPISFLGWMIEALIIVIFSYGLDSPMSIYRALMVVAGVNIAIALPSSPGNIGTFQLGAMTMLVFMGIPKGEAATIAILYHLVQLVPTVLIGAAGYYYYFFKTRQVRVEPSLDELAATLDDPSSAASSSVTKV
jgi:uncharacterized membrane protein YbhN (UPF0104 family)